MCVFGFFYPFLSPPFTLNLKHTKKLRKTNISKTDFELCVRVSNRLNISHFSTGSLPLPSYNSKTQQNASSLNWLLSLLQEIILGKNHYISQFQTKSNRRKYCWSCLQLWKNVLKEDIGIVLRKTWWACYSLVRVIMEKMEVSNIY